MYRLLYVRVKTFLDLAGFCPLWVSLSWVHVQTFVSSADIRAFMFNWCFLMFIILCVHQIFVRWCPIIVHSGSDVRALMSRQSCVDYQAFFCSPEICTFIFSLSFLGFQTSVLSSEFLACFSNFPGILQTNLRSSDSRAFMIIISCVHIPNFVHSSPDVCVIIFGQCEFIVRLPCIHHNFLRACLLLGAFARLFCVNV